MAAEDTRSQSSRSPRNAAASEEETQPLLRPTATMKHEPTIYSFMLFQPELSRLSQGNYWAPPVVLAFVLLILNLTMQLALSYIAGSHITFQHTFFTETLLKFGGDSLDAITPEEFMEDYFWDVHKKIKGVLFGEEFDKDTCCNAAECSEMGLTCCDRTGAAPHDSKRPIFSKMRNIQDLQDINMSYAPAPAPALVEASAPSAAPRRNDPSASGTYAKDVVGSFLAFTKPGGGSGKASKGDGDGGKKGDAGPTIYKTAAVCHFRNETMDCSPDSFAFMHSWPDLDKDGDGLWTLDEARADEANLGCRLGMSVEEIFRSVSRGVVRDAKDTAGNSYATPFVPFSVEERHAIPRKYFDWWRGLVAFCTVADGARCGEMVQRGVFDGVIGAPDPKAHRGGVVDIDTAIDYCQRLLSSGGICDQTLPGTYVMYRSKLFDKCGESSYNLGEKHTNPHDGRDITRTIKVTYANEKEYQMCSGSTYTFFLSLVLYLWYANLSGEAHSCIRFIDFLVNFPKASGGAGMKALMKPIRKFFRRAGLQRSGTASFSNLSFSATPSEAPAAAEDDSEDDHFKPVHRMESLAFQHLIMCWIVLALRIWLLLWMCRVGSTYLLYTKSYEDLLMNSVALGFIFDLPAFLYQFLVNNQLKDKLCRATTIPYPTSLPAGGNWKSGAVNKSVWAIFVIPIMVFIQVYTNRYSNILPSAAALTCACHQEGENCLVSEVLSKSWWNRYWQEFAVVQTSPFHGTAGESL